MRPRSPSKPLACSRLAKNWRKPKKQFRIQPSSAKYRTTPQHRRRYPPSNRTKNPARQAAGLRRLRQSQVPRKAYPFSATVLLLHASTTQESRLPCNARGRKAQKRKNLSATLRTDCPENFGDPSSEVVVPGSSIACIFFMSAKRLGCDAVAAAPHTGDDVCAPGRLWAL